MDDCNRVNEVTQAPGDDADSELDTGLANFSPSSGLFGAHNGITSSKAPFAKLARMEKFTRLFEPSASIEAYLAATESMRNLVVPLPRMELLDLVKQTKSMVEPLAGLQDSLALAKSSQVLVDAMRTSQFFAHSIPHIEIPKPLLDLEVNPGLISSIRELSASAEMFAEAYRPSILALADKVSPNLHAFAKQQKFLEQSLATSPAIKAAIADVGRMADLAAALKSSFPVITPEFSAAIRGIDNLNNSFAHAAMREYVILERFSLVVGSFNLGISDTRTDERKAKLAEALQHRRSEAPTEYREKTETFDVTAFLASSPFHWFGSDTGLLFAIAKSHLNYSAALIANATELALEVSRDERIHSFIESRISAFSPRRAKAFRNAVRHFMDGDGDSAIPILIIHLEGLIVDVAASLGLVQKDSTQQDKPYVAGTTTPVRSVEDAVNLLRRSNSLPEDQWNYLKLQVYGGRGNPYRHGHAPLYDHEQASRLILGFYLMAHFC